MSDWHRRDCKGCGQLRMIHTLAYCGGVWEWRCENCGLRTPRREQKARVRKPGLTAMQQKAVEQIRENLVRQHYNSQADHYEMKKFETKDCGSFVSVIAETGMKEDEGTKAAVLCRRRVHVAVGRCGGVEVLNAKYKSRRHGWFAVFHGLVGY